MNNGTCRFKILSSSEDGHPLTKNAKKGLIDGLKEDAIEHYREYLLSKQTEMSKKSVKIHEKIISDIENGYSEEVLSSINSIKEDVPQVVFSWASMDVCAKNCKESG